MKFSYEQRECVAYLDEGYLIIKDETGRCVALSSLGIGKSPVWDERKATEKFYKGDSVTITF